MWHYVQVQIIYRYTTSTTIIILYGTTVLHNMCEPIHIVRAHEYI
jgi:hypothetical protein